VTVIGIFGPTASGKSRVAAEVAGRIPAELVSADALQVYRGLPILTNQPTEPTRMVGIWPLDREASVGE
jgi:tRNA dimethylallyltransferase